MHDPHTPVKSSRQSRHEVVARDSELPQISDRPVAPKTVQRRHIALGVLLLVSFAAVARLAAPVWVGIVFGVLMAFTAQPIYRRVSARMGGRPHTAALMTTMLTGSLCVVAGVVALYVLTRELFSIIAFLQHRLESGTLAGLIGDNAVKIVKRVGLSEVEVMRRIQDGLASAANYATEAAGLVLQTTATAVMGLVIGCITMYCVLVDWPSIPLRLERILPLDPHHTRALVLEFRDIGRSAIVGTMATAVFQGVVASIGYSISGLPHAVTWGLFTGLASFFPVLGTAIIWAPVSLYFVSRGEILPRGVPGCLGPPAGRRHRRLHASTAPRWSKGQRAPAPHAGGSARWHPGVRPRRHRGGSGDDVALLGDPDHLRTRNRRDRPLPAAAHVSDRPGHRSERPTQKTSAA